MLWFINRIYTQRLIHEYIDDTGIFLSQNERDIIQNH